MKKSRHLVSIQKRLSILTLSIAACISIVFFIALLVWQGVYYRKDRFQQLTFMADSAFSQVNHALSNLDTLSLSIAYSTSASDDYSNFLNSSHTNQYDTHISYKKLTDTLLSMVGPSLSVPQVYIYNRNHFYFGVGIDHAYQSTFQENDFDFLEFSSITGTTTFTLPHRDSRISNAAIYEQNGIYISAFRTLKNNLNVTTGYVEVVQRYGTIFRSLQELKQSSMEAYVFTSKGELVYPLTEQTELTDRIYDYAVSTDFRTSDWNKFEHNQYLYSYSSSPAGYIYVISIDSGMLFSGFGSLIFMICSLFLPIIILLTLICLYVSHSFTKPIKALCDSIASMDLSLLSGPVFGHPGYPKGVSSNQKLDFPILPTNILEVSQLNTLIHKMTVSINTYMERLLLSQEQEIQTKILALQVQTNPHFIYNILFNISAMSAAGMNEEIEDLCGKIGKLMQYCSSSKSSLVSLEEELYYTSMYVQCMCIRFPHLQYEVNVEEEMCQIQIPKLILQLLVENAIKFCTTISPPWKVTFRASQENGFHLLTVSDNGSGFTEERRRELEYQFSCIKESKMLPHMELNGMGIINVYLRLLLIFGDEVQILLSNNQPHGAKVTLKIPIIAKTQTEKTENTLNG